MKFMGMAPRSKAKKEIAERDIEKAYVKRVAKEGGKAYKFTSEMNRGVSDRLTVFPGQVWFVEIKRLDGKLTKLQKLFRDYIISLELNYFTVYGLEGINAFIEEVRWVSKNGSRARKRQRRQ